MSSYPFKNTILGMVPEGVNVDEEYIKQLAISKDTDLSTISNLWYKTMEQERGGSTREQLQETIDEYAEVIDDRDNTIKDLQAKIQDLIKERDDYKDQLSKPSKEYDNAVKECVDLNDKLKKYKAENRELKEEIKTLGNLLENGKASYKELRDKYDNLCKEHRDYNTLAQELEECEGANRDLANENNRVRNDNERLKETIVKLKCDIEEQDKYISYMKENCVSKEVYKEERGYAEREIKQRIEDTKDLIRAIHTISKFI